MVGPADGKGHDACGEECAAERKEERAEGRGKTLPAEEYGEDKRIRQGVDNGAERDANVPPSFGKQENGEEVEREVPKDTAGGHPYGRSQILAGIEGGNNDLVGGENEQSGSVGGHGTGGPKHGIIAEGPTLVNERNRRRRQGHKSQRHGCHDQEETAKRTGHGGGEIGKVALGRLAAVGGQENRGEGGAEQAKGKIDDAVGVFQGRGGPGGAIEGEPTIHADVDLREGDSQRGGPHLQQDLPNVGRGTPSRE